MTFKTLDGLDVAGKRVLVRADLNVPVRDGKISDLTRIERLCPTIREMADTGAKVIGYLASCAPPQGPVQYAVLSKVQVLDSAGNVLARFDELPLVPNNLVGFKVTEGPL